MQLHLPQDTCVYACDVCMHVICELKLILFVCFILLVYTHCQAHINEISAEMVYYCYSTVHLH